MWLGRSRQQALERGFTPRDGPDLKTERAKHHIDELERIFKSYVASNRKALTPKYNRKPRGRALGAHFPKHTPTILGDALHNLRAALDHAYCVLVEANGGTVNKHTKFPFTEKGTRQDLEASTKGQAKASGGPSDEMIGVVFDEIQPYPGGKGEDLVSLHVLDIADKHMTLLSTQQTTSVQDVRFEGGGGISNIAFVTDRGVAIDFGPGAGLDPKHHHKVSFDICFGGAQPFEGQPILPILKGLAARVNETLRLLEQRAKETP